jgi:integrase
MSHQLLPIFEELVDKASGEKQSNQVKNYFRSSLTDEIWFRKNIDGEEFKFSTGEKTLPRAVASANKEIKRRLQIRKGQGPRRLLGDYMDSILALREREYESGNIGKGTFHNTRNGFKKLRPFWADKFPEDVTPEKWSEYQDWYSLHYPGEDQENVTKYMRVLCTVLVEKNELPKKPKIKDRYEKSVEIRRKRTKQLEQYSEEDVLKLLSKGNFQDRLAVRFGAQMAFRIGDVCALEWVRIRLSEDHPELERLAEFKAEFPEIDVTNFNLGDLTESQRLKLPNLDLLMPEIFFMLGDDKADTEATAPIPDEIYYMLLELKKSATSRWVFPQKINPDQHLKPQQIYFEELRKAAGLKHGSFHTLRHFCLTRDFKNPKFTAAQVMMIRRVSYEVAQEHYIHVDNRDKILMRNSIGLSSDRKQGRGA